MPCVPTNYLPFTLLRHLPDGHSAEHVNAAMAARIRELPAALARSIT
jgi:IS30 family transposase